MGSCGATQLHGTMTGGAVAASICWRQASLSDTGYGRCTIERFVKSAHGMYQHPIGTCAWIRFAHRLHLSRSIASCLRASHSVCERYTGSGKCRPKDNIIEGSRGIIATSNGRDARRSGCCSTLLKYNRKFHRKIHRTERPPNLLH